MMIIPMMMIIMMTTMIMKTTTTITIKIIRLIICRLVLPPAMAKVCLNPCSEIKVNNIVNHINDPGSWEATTLKRCATSSSKRIGEKLKKKLSKKENFLILHKYFLQGNIMFYVTRF